MRMKVVRGLAVALFLMGSFWSVIAQAGTIDQNINDGWWLQIQYAQPIAQSFTAEDASVDLIGMYIGDGNASFNDLTVSMALYSGDGIFSADHLLLSQDINVGALAGGEGYADMDVSGYAFSVGSSYTMALFNDTPRWGALLAGRDLYPGGILYTGFGPNPSAESRFHVFPATTVPEPASILLFGAGMAGLAATGLRRRS